jgi:hypothetical protein
VDTSYRKLIDLRAGGLDDPDATRAATVLGAYFRAEQASTLRRRVWRGAAICLLAAWALNVIGPGLTRVDIFFGLGLIGTAAIATAIAELQARSRLDSLVDGERG